MPLTALHSESDAHHQYENDTIVHVLNPYFICSYIWTWRTDKCHLTDSHQFRANGLWVTLEGDIYIP